MKKIILTLIIVVLAVLTIWFGVRAVFWFKNYLSERAFEKARDNAIESVINSRINEQNIDSDHDPFGDKQKINILLIGLDKRIGTTSTGHCDAIQMASIDKESQIVTITAVPRGTYSPLPPGKGTTSSDYYVSNACDLGGLEYGINQIEKILRQKADYLVLVGFSETLGILRNLKLPATETLQWLRHRQSYQIGEPQRAHNHSTFLKQMLIEHIPKNNSTLDSALQYLIYSRLKTDLSFAQVKIIINTLSEMNLSENPDKIILSMNPPYPVQDIEYDQDNLANFLQSRIEPIKHLLSKDDFSGMDSASAQNKLIDLIEQNIDDDDFAIWAYENYLWLQIENTEILLAKQYDLMKKYVSLIDEKTKRQALIADYILEMEYFDEKDYIEKGKKLLQSELGY
jgi:anionic cell wall polymer biosynthesis LytR-Cps2A-Psr (LCP) family protein